jgi:hypothetical protein
MAGRDEGTGALIEPRNNRARRRLAVTIIRRLQSFTQWWVSLNEPHTQKFGHFQKLLPPLAKSIEFMLLSMFVASLHSSEAVFKGW